MCRVLNINESGYYRWCRNSIIPGNRELLLVEIKKIIGECPENENYGIERIRTALEQVGYYNTRRINGFNPEDGRRLYTGILHP